MTATINDLSAYPPAALYALFKDVYTSTDLMSETLEDKYPDLRAFEQDMAVLQSLPGAVALAAEIDQRPVAYLIIRPRRQAKLRHTADLNVGVAASARGQGVGGSILQAGLERALAAPKLEIVYLMVRSDNAPAIHLYRKLGFETLAVLDRDIKSGGSYFDGILMRRFVNDEETQ